MNTAMIKEQLHDYIERADEKHLEAMYVLLSNEITAHYKYDEKTVEMLNKRKDSHLNETSKSYSMAESFELIRASKK